jgi:hypothetical protein
MSERWHQVEIALDFQEKPIMKPKLNYRSAICLICMAIFSLILLNVVDADDQSPPPGMDKGVWVLNEKKPDFGTAEDTDAYFDNKVDPSEYNVKGSLSWGDDKCSGSEWGTSSWSEIPTVLEPGVEQTTTLTAEVGGSQNCAYRHVSARTALIVNGDKPGPEASISYPTSDPKPDPVSVKVPWKAPWGKIGDKLTVTVVAQVPAATAMHCGFDYIYTYEAPGSQPDQPNVPKQTGSFVLPNPQQENEPPVPSQTDIAAGTTSLPKGSDDGPSSGDGRDGNTNSDSESYVQPCLPCQYGDSGVRFTDISGEVDLRPFCNEHAWKTAEIRTTPCVDDHVRTGEDSFAILSFADMTTFVMKPETEIILDTPPQKDSKVKLVSGKIWENVKKMIMEGSMEVEMSQAVLGIKGTTVVCEETGSTSILKVLEGTASFRSKTTGEEILVSAGEMATATENGLSQPRPFDIDAETASWTTLTSKTEEIYFGQEGYSLLKEGNDYIKDGNVDAATEYWEKADKAFDSAIEIDPLNALYWNGKGCALTSINMFNNENINLEAVWAFDNATKLDPENAKFWDYKGIALFSTEKYEQALKAWDKAIELDPQNAFIYWSRKGDILGVNLDRYDEASEAYARAEALAGLEITEISERYPYWPLI